MSQTRLNLTQTHHARGEVIDRAKIVTVIRVVTIRIDSCRPTIRWLDGQ